MCALVLAGVSVQLQQICRVSGQLFDYVKTFALKILKHILDNFCNFYGIISTNTQESMTSMDRNMLFSNVTVTVAIFIFSYRNHFLYI